MKATIDGMRLTESWKTGVVHSGAKPSIVVPNSPKPETVWNGNPIAPFGSTLYLPGLPGSGGTIYDFSGQRNDGTINTATWQRLTSGLRYLDFNGTDNVNCGQGAGVSIGTSDFTLAIWFRCTLGGFLRFLFGKGTAGAGGKRYQFYIDGGAPGNFLEGQIDDNTAGAVVINGATDVVDSLWHRTIATFDRDGNCQIYLDGNTDGVAVDISAHDADIDTANDLYVGADVSGATGEFVGSLALATIYKGLLLTPHQIDLDYRQTRHLFNV